MKRKHSGNNRSVQGSRANMPPSSDASQGVHSPSLHSGGVVPVEPSGKKEGGRKRLSPLEKARRRIGLSDAALKHLVEFVRCKASQRPYPEVEDVAMEALTRALVTYVPGRESTTVINWVASKLNYALWNLGAHHSSTKVRDAFVAFEQLHGFKPNIAELRQFAQDAMNMKLDMKQVVLALPMVARELDLPEHNNSLLNNLIDLMRMDTCSDQESTREIDEMVKQTLSCLRPSDAFLIILKHLCGFEAQEVTDVMNHARKIYARSNSVDEVDLFLDSIAIKHDLGLNIPWHCDLLRIAKRRQLAVRLHRAHIRFQCVFRRLFPDQSTARMRRADTIKALTPPLPNRRKSCRK